jgi:hypothetical protein
MMTENTPEWEKYLKVKNTEPTVSSFMIPSLGTPTPSVPSQPRRSDAERIEVARAILIQRDRASNADLNYGGRHTPEFFIDPKGFGSAWLARHIVYLSQLLNTQLLGHTLNIFGLAEKYIPWTGVFEAADSRTRAVGSSH